MRILLYTDVHWSTTTSIIRQRGEKYSLRLELLIKSMNWAENLATRLGCEEVICAGDFFDKSTLNDEEISALSEIKWCDAQHTFIVGNHESGKSMLQFNTTNALSGHDNIHVISKQGCSSIYGRTQVHFVPYIVESDRQNLDRYICKEPICDKHIIISHNDIQGINYGGFESKVGFTIDEIERNCSLYLNGHLHNGERVSKKIFNMGSLSAHNFTNDSNKYEYGCWVVDTDTLELEFYENPFSLKFYKFEIDNDKAASSFVDFLSVKRDLSVIAVKCKSNVIERVATALKQAKSTNRLLDYKLTMVSEDAKAVDHIDDFSMNHLERFCSCVHETLGVNDIIDFELGEVCK